MKKHILIFLLSASASAFAQSKYIKSGSIGEVKPAAAEKPAADDHLLYGPVPYRTLKETIGETYVILRRPKILGEKNDFIYLHKRDTTKLFNKDIVGKLIKLTSIDEDANGIFKSDDNVMYISVVSKTFPEVAPVRDVDEASKMFLNKTLWLNHVKAYTYNAVTDKNDPFRMSRFEPVTVTEITASTIWNAPVMIIFKTANGKTAFAKVDVSGTNTEHETENLFTTQFFTKNPKLTYRFTPAIWKAIERFETPIGMPAEAFELLKGRPDKINRSRSGNTYREQWVYGIYSPTYYYFTNNKYTGYN